MRNQTGYMCDCIQCERKSVRGHSDLECEHNVVILTETIFPLAPVAAQPHPIIKRR